MFPFYIVLFINTSLGYLARIKEKKNLENKYMVSPNFFIFLIITFIFVMFSGLRKNTGLDTWMYRHSYDLVVAGFQSNYEPGFNLMIKFLTGISSDSQIFIFVTAMVTNIFIMLSLRRYATLYELSIFLYVVSGYYLVTMNGIRQSFAASLFFYFGIKFISERDFIKYTIFMFLLSFFHDSVAMLYPIYFFAREKAWSKRILVFIILSLLGVFFFNNMIGVGEVVSGKYANYLTEFKEGGANILRVAVEGVPVFLAFIKREELRKKWHESNIFVNLSLLNFIFMMFSLHNWIFARFSMYLSLVNLVLIPYILKTCFNEESNEILYIICMVLYFIFYFLDSSVFGSTIYRSLILGIN
ncbi:MAG: EpsG family protein [Fusobacteriaceae bacterium]